MTPNTGKVAELTTFIFSVSRCQRMYKCFASISVMKLLVVPKSTMVLLTALWLIQASTHIRPRSADFFISFTLFCKANNYFSDPIRGLSQHSQLAVFLFLPFHTWLLNSLHVWLLNSLHVWLEMGIFLNSFEKILTKK